MELFNYLAQANIYLVLFYILYVLLLRNETFFRLNRLFLAGSAVLSCLIPFMQLVWVQDIAVSAQVKQVAQTVNLAALDVVAQPAAVQTGYTAKDMLLMFYLAGVLFSACIFVYKLIKLGSAFRKQQDGAFSFFHKIVVSDDLAGRETIYRHELMHARQLHTADVLFFELLAIINWFNPVIYLYKIAIKHIHEFIADEASATHQTSKADYALLMLSQTLGVQPHQLTNSFFNQSLLKRRIVMLHKTKSKRIAVLKYGLAVPLFAGMMVFSAATIDTSKLAEDLAGHEISKNSASKAGDYRRFPADEPANDLISYLQKNTVYPRAARQKHLEHNSLVTFTIGTDKKIRDIKYEKRSPEFSNSLSSTLQSFSGAFLKNPGTYAMTVNYDIAGIDNENRVIPLNPVPKNYIGMLTIIGYGMKSKSSKPNNGNSMSENKSYEIPAGPNNVTVVQTDSSIYDFASVEILPEFPGGGMAAFMKYLQENYKTPAEAKKAGVSGRMIAAFIVEIDGRLTDVNVIRDLGYGTGTEAIKLLENSPKWKPGIHNGQPVRVAYTLPFKIDAAAIETGKQIVETQELTVHQINGKEVTKEEFDTFRKSAKKFTWINTMINPEKAVKLYGEKAKNGAVILNLETKK